MSQAPQVIGRLETPVAVTGLAPRRFDCARVLTLGVVGQPLILASLSNRINIFPGRAHIDYYYPLHLGHFHHRVLLARSYTLLGYFV